MSNLLENFVGKNHSLIPDENEIQFTESRLTIKAWNWDYDQCHQVQENAVELIRENQELEIFLLTNHPHCFTLGRGAQHDRENHGDNLLTKDFPFPIHKIFRGGGLTFHYPGQLIFYPIKKLSPKTWTLNQHLCWLLKSTEKLLQNEFLLENAKGKMDPLGVWVGQNKLASIGVGSKRYVTFHGMALNLNHDQKMFNALKSFSPCGLSSSIYTSTDVVAELTQGSIDLDLVARKFLQIL